MLSIEALYEEEEYNDYLVMLASKNLIEFDDFKQDVFVNILEEEDVNRKKCMLIADKIAKRTKRKNMRDYAYSLDEERDSYPEDAPSVLWEDNHVIEAGKDLY